MFLASHVRVPLITTHSKIRNFIKMSVQLAETAEDVSTIAFGFMASKALFAGLHMDVFTHLADEPKTSKPTFPR